MMFTKLDNDVLVNNISLLYIRVNANTNTVEYALANGKVIKEKFDTLEGAYDAYEAIETAGLIQLMNGYILNPHRIESIENPKHDQRRIFYSLGRMGTITEKYKTAEEGSAAFEEMDKTNYVEVGENILLNPMFIDAVEKDPINAKGVSYTLNSFRTVKDFFEDAATADSKLTEVITKLENFEYTEPKADSRNFLKLASAKLTKGGDNTPEYYKNLELLTIEKAGNNVINVKASSGLTAFANAGGMVAPWYGIIVDLGIARDKVVALSGYNFDSAETNAAEAQKWGATGNNEFILWLTGNQDGNRQIIFGDKDNTYKPTTINIVFGRGVIETTPDIDDNPEDSEQKGPSEEE